MLDIVVEDAVCPFTDEDLERVRAVGVECEFYAAGRTIVVFWVPLEVCDNTIIKLLRGGAHPNIKRRRDLRWVT